MIGLESRFINSPTGITLAPTASTGGSYISPVSYTHLTLPTICSV